MWWNIILGPVMETFNRVIDKLVPDVAGAAKIKLEMAQELQRMDFQAMTQQIAVNLEEAKHDSVFVAGWRPFIGWVCGVALGWQFVGLKIALFFIALYKLDVGPLPQFDYAELTPILLGMLGLGGMRTYEKIKGETTTAVRVGS